MKTKRIGLAAAVLACTSVPAVAQEHWTEGPVWECSSYRTLPGQFDNYMKWIRAHAAVVDAEAKKQGLILDSKSFVKAPSGPEDWDVMFCTAYPNFAKALDYSQADEDKFDAINEAHWSTKETDKLNEATAPRLEMRKYLGTTYLREVDLRPIG